MNSEFIARTGRVQSWLDNPDSRLPVSCTVFEVDDSMTGPEGIEASWKFVSTALRGGAGVAVHLSKLRPKGTVTQKGPDQLVASGPCSFGKLYSMLNEILRRGGTYRNGAVVLTLDLGHPDILEFIEMKRSEIPWAKRCINLNQLMWDNATPEVKAAVLEGISKGDIWLAKIRYCNGKRIFSNVCLEVWLFSRATCLLEHINVGMCQIDQIQGAFVEGMIDLCELHKDTGVGENGEYTPPSLDRQVGLGMLGLANLLAIEGVTYEEFADALEDHINYYGDSQHHNCQNPTALRIVEAIDSGIKASAQVARQYNMDRAFAIAPTASCSYRYKDRKGFTTTPEIAPPIGRKVDRDSETFGTTSFFYGDVQTAEDVGFEVYFRVANGIMELLNRTGLAHGYSFNWWSDQMVMSEDFIQQWMDSPQTSLYYALQTKMGAMAKDDAMAALDGQWETTFNFTDLDDSEEEAVDFAALFNDPTGCVGCAE